MPCDKLQQAKSLSQHSAAINKSFLTSIKLSWAEARDTLFTRCFTFNFGTTKLIEWRSCGKRIAMSSFSLEIFLSWTIGKVVWLNDQPALDVISKICDWRQTSTNVTTDLNSVTTLFNANDFIQKCLKYFYISLYSRRKSLEESASIWALFLILHHKSNASLVAHFQNVFFKLSFWIGHDLVWHCPNTQNYYFSQFCSFSWMTIIPPPH